jgi:hypothetical protein
MGKAIIQKIVSMSFVLAAFLAPAVGQAEEYPYSVGLGFEFGSGKYGTNTRTDTVLVPFTVAYSPTNRLGISLEIPFAYQSNGNVVSSVAMGAGGMQGSRATMLAAGRAGSSMNGGLSPSTSSNRNSSESGLGDINLKVAYILIPEKDSMPQIRPSAFVKFPTADKNKSLGTGEFDEGFAMEVSKWFGKWNPFAEMGYTVQGRTQLLALRNYLAYDVGTGYQVSDRFRPIVFLKGSSPPADGSSSLLEVRLKLKYQASTHTGIDGYLSKGVTTNSPDYGTGLSVYYDF